MANERKTENIVRDHFRKDAKQILIEEQISDSPKIKKLLSTASKAGSGSGYPEFIIQVKENSELIIIVECKAKIEKHESVNRDNPKEYAVDGALLYASYLSRDYDVLSIAVSGEKKSNIKISHFLQLKGENKAIQKFGGKLLSIDNYLEGYIKSPEKLRQDYNSLIMFSRDLNKKLHKNKILESDRSLLISCVLIALENKAFLKSYKDYTKPEDLAKYLVNTVEMEFKNSGIQDSKLNIVKSRFEFIKTDTSLSKKDCVLRDVIIDIDENINKFIKTHEYFDVLSQLYIEFLRYANSDKGLGIVLTPPHITEFMAELAQVNKNSVVYDNCAGTGGFLISAMNLMIKNADGDQNKIKKIKNKQLIGVEYQANIFALACSNMFIHQDGKTNIFNGSCFDEKMMNEMKKKNPTVGLLNPPYKADKDDDEELEFVLNNLDTLEQGGKCVAIVPLNSVLAQSGAVFELKKKLLEKHTLDAVLSMPNELFFNSKVTVVTCIMIFTAKRPHPVNKKTFLGYFKEDGFVKRKNKGRIDLYNQWSSIKEKWIDAYINKADISKLSINQVVTANDEWCAEAYLKTNYSTLSEKDFEEEVKKYISFKIQSL
jgi:type I restriction-modification system DNA methylase subunit